MKVSDEMFEKIWAAYLFGKGTNKDCFRGAIAVLPDMYTVEQVMRADEYIEKIKKRLTQQTPAAPCDAYNHAEQNATMQGCDCRETPAASVPQATPDAEPTITLAEHKAKMRAAIEFISRHWVSGDVEACKDECMRKFGFTEPTPADRVTVTKNSEPSGEYYPYGVALDGCVDAIFITEKNAERYALGLISQLEKESQ